MRASNQQLTLLTKAEQSALYDIPEFDNDQRLEFLTFSENKQALICSRSSLAAIIYCALQLGYFKAVKIFFNFFFRRS